MGTAGVVHQRQISTNQQLVAVRKFAGAWAASGHAKPYLVVTSPP